MYVLFRRLRGYMFVCLLNNIDFFFFFANIQMFMFIDRH